MAALQCQLSKQNFYLLLFFPCPILTLLLLAPKSLWLGERLNQNYLVQKMFMSFKATRLSHTQTCTHTHTHTHTHACTCTHTHTHTHGTATARGEIILTLSPATFLGFTPLMMETASMTIRTPSGGLCSARTSTTSPLFKDFKLARAASCVTTQMVRQ